MIRRWKAVEGRWKALFLLGGAFVILGVTGIYGHTNDLELTEAEAIETASEYLDFEPEIAEARIIRHGFFRQPVWAVNFRTPDPDGSRTDFLRHLTVEINAVTGKVIRIGDDGVTEFEE